MMLTRLPLGLHVAVLDLESGNGLLVLPHEGDDLQVCEGQATLHHADLLAALIELDRLGWEPSEDDDGGLLIEDQRTPDGRRVAGLFGREPIASGLSLDSEAAGWPELLAACAGG